MLTMNSRGLLLLKVNYNLNEQAETVHNVQYLKE